PDGECALLQVASVREMTLSTEYDGQVVHALGCIRMLGPQYSLPNIQCALVYCPGLAKTTLLPEQDAQVVERGCCFWMLRFHAPFSHRQDVLEQAARNDQLSLCP